MNFIEAAMAVLAQGPSDAPTSGSASRSGTPSVSAGMTVEQLCQIALDSGLIDAPGANSVRSMKSRLTTELRKGKKSRVRCDDDGLWTLAPVETAQNRRNQPRSKANTVPEKIAAKQSKRKAAQVTAQIKTVAPKTGPLAQVSGSGETLAKVSQHADIGHATAHSHSNNEDIAEKTHTAAGDSREVARSQETAESRHPGSAFVTHFAQLPVPSSHADGANQASGEVGNDSDGASTFSHAPANVEPVNSASFNPAIAATDAEPAVVRMFDRLEFFDSRSPDEDRIMLPEIRAGHHRNGRGFPNHRGKDARGTPAAPAVPPAKPIHQGNGPKPVHAAQPRQPAPEHAKPAVLREQESGAGTPSAQVEEKERDLGLLASAMTVLRSLKGGQPVPVRQLAQMMKKRRLVADDGERVWKSLRLELLHSIQQSRQEGLPSSLSYRHRDLFSYRSGTLEVEENELTASVAKYRERVRKHLWDVLGKLPIVSLEQIAHQYLLAKGFTGVTWIKRAEPSSYASAIDPNMPSKQVLISVRAGDDLIDRRGIGELRAGAVAKNALRGFLLAPRPLSADAAQELEKNGRSIGLCTGWNWIDELCSLGIGVELRRVSLPVIDGEFFERLKESSNA